MKVLIRNIVIPIDSITHISKDQYADEPIVFLEIFLVGGGSLWFGRGEKVNLDKVYARLVDSDNLFLLCCRWMRWLSKYTQARFEEGTTRLVRVFAFLPTYVMGKIVWLERYEVLQAYIIQVYKLKVDGADKAFEVGTWVEISKRTMD
jgi:hypothetical protein